MKFIHSISRLLIAIGLLFCLSHYKELIHKELSLADNNGKVKLVATEPQLFIEGIKVNDHYISDEQVSKNEWYVASVDIVNNLLISEGENATIEIQADSPVKTISFDYRTSSEKKYIRVYVDDILAEVIDTSIGDYNQNLAHIQLKQEETVDSNNLIWYIQLGIYLVGILLFSLTPLVVSIRPKTLITLLVIIVSGHFLVDLIFPLFYRDKLVLFHSEFSPSQLKNLLTVFSVLTATSLISFKHQRNRLASLIQRIVSPACFFISPLLALYLTENSYSQIGNISQEYADINLIILYALYGILLLFTNAKIAAFLLVLAATCAGIANKILIDVRESPLLFHNIFQVQDGLNVASNLNITGNYISIYTNHNM